MSPVKIVAVTVITTADGADPRCSDPRRGSHGGGDPTSIGGPKRRTSRAAATDMSPSGDSLARIGKSK